MNETKSNIMIGIIGAGGHGEVNKNILELIHKQHKFHLLLLLLITQIWYVQFESRFT